jgi:hypothetical protein
MYWSEIEKKRKKKRPQISKFRVSANQKAR